MAFRFWDALKYVDEVVTVAVAVQEYAHHKDEGLLVDGITRALLSAIRDTVGDPSSQIDEERIRRAVVEIVDELQPLF